ncbi:hypothetical protein BC832DRAFT_224183 [Gaertneriomyces semiglobifer]|nr:hypothetical protein BC832DRAFT_224183 [Gaertneriomyces semiglobifer]
MDDACEDDLDTLQEDFIVQLPVNCNGGQFARIVKRADPPRRLRKRQGPTPTLTTMHTDTVTADAPASNFPTLVPTATQKSQASTTSPLADADQADRTVTLLLDQDFGAIPEPQDPSDYIDFYIDVASGNELLDPAPGIDSRSLNKRAPLGDFKDWLARKNRYEKTAGNGFSARYDFAQGLVHAEATCAEGDFEARAMLEIGISGYASVYGLYSAKLSGSFIPPKVDQAYAYFSSGKVNVSQLKGGVIAFLTERHTGGEMEMTLDLHANALLAYQKPNQRFFAMDFTPLQIPKIISVGPRIEVHAGLVATLELDATFQATARVSLPGIYIAVSNTGESESNKLPSSLTSAKFDRGKAAAEFGGEVVLTGNLEITVVPRALLAISLFDGRAQAGIGMDITGRVGADLTGGANLEWSSREEMPAEEDENGPPAEEDQPSILRVDPLCMSLYGGFDVDAYAGGQFFGYQMSFNPKLYGTGRQPLWEQCIFANDDPTFCPATARGWPRTEIGGTAEWPCPFPSSGVSSAICQAGGNWAEADLSDCSMQICPGAELGDEWLDTPIGQTAEAPCVEGGFGRQTAYCGTSGKWQNRRGCIKDFCQGKALGPGWLDTLAGKSTSKPCDPPSKEFATATCLEQDRWGPVNDTNCQSRTHCPADGAWKETVAGQIAIRFCGFGIAFRQCDATGHWLAPTGMCSCPADGPWEASGAGVTAVMQCEQGQASRLCSASAVWEPVSWDTCRCPADDGWPASIPSVQKIAKQCARGPAWRTCLLTGFWETAPGDKDQLNCVCPSSEDWKDPVFGRNSRPCPNQQGVMHQTCLRTGEWAGDIDASECQCLSDDGFPTTQSGQIAQKKCYASEEVITRRCHNGRWEDFKDFSKCTCQPDDGWLATAPGVVGEKTCPAGGGKARRTCTKDAYWAEDKDYSQCQCQLDDGFGPAKPGTQFRRPCDSGLGQVVRTCLANGIWDDAKDFSQCSCGPDDGFPVTRAGTVGRKRCDSGIGEATRQCTARGVWEDAKDFSQCSCGPDDGFPVTRAGTVGRKRCDSGIGEATRQCTPRGVWADAKDFSQCSCGPDDGFPVTRAGTVGRKRCDSGIGEATRQCTPRGVWEDAKNYSNCQCGADDGWAATRAGTVGRKRCDSGIGEATRRCNAQGNWEGGKDYSNCQCGADDGWAATRAGMTGVKKCPSGFGEAYRRCNELGYWGGQKDHSRCQCPPDDGWGVTWAETYGTKQCPGGETVSRYCHSPGVWGNKPQCEPDFPAQVRHLYDVCESENLGLPNCKEAGFGVKCWRVNCPDKIGCILSQVWIGALCAPSMRWSRFTCRWAIRASGAGGPCGLNDIEKCSCQVTTLRCRPGYCLWEGGDDAEYVNEGEEQEERLRIDA